MRLVRARAFADHPCMTNPLVTPVLATVNEPSSTPDGDDGGALIRSLLEALPPLTDAQRSAFTRQCSAEKADDWGTRTKAINVLHDSERFARDIHSALAAPRGGLGYTKPRFRFYLEATLDLRDKIAKDRTRSLAQSTAVVSVEKAHDVALVTRETLIERMHAFAEGDDVRASAVAQAAGSTKDDDAILSSLDALLKLARGWLTKPDPADQALADSVGLDSATLDSFESARTALATAHSTSLGSGGKVWRDSPETNRIEGRVLFEMRYAMRLFEGAHGRDGLSPRLIPGPGTRHVLAPNRKVKSGGAAAQPAAGQPAGEDGDGKPNK